MNKSGSKRIHQVALRTDLQCGSCGSLHHRDGDGPKYCSCCAAAFDRYCIACRKKVDMFFEEWWPGENECIRTYSPAKFCPYCKASLEVHLKNEAKIGSSYEH